MGGDGAYGGQDDGWGQGEAGGFEEGDQVAGRGGAREGDGVRVGVRGGEEGLEGWDGVRGELVAVGFGYGDGGSGGGEGFGEDVAGLGGSDKEHAGVGGVGSQGFGERFGYVLRGDEGYGEADSLHCSGGGWAYDGDSGELGGRVLWLGG